MNVLFTCTLGLDISLLDRLADSVDYNIPWKIVLNNGALGVLEEFSRKHPDWVVKEEGLNLGVAGSWNFANKLFPDEPTMLIVNDDAFFLPGYLEKIVRCADDNPDAPLIHCNDSNAYYAFVSTRAGREKFGPFDDNLWPAYYEDVEMRIRHRIAGVITYPYALQGLPPLPHGKPRTGGVNYNAMIQGCGLFNRAYMLKKWNSYNDLDASFRANPYGDHRLSYRDVVWYPEERAMRHPLWRTFMELPNPSIYE